MMNHWKRWRRFLLVWLRRGVVWSLVILVALDGVGVLLTARPTVVEWDTILTTGFPSGRPFSVNTLTVGPDESLYAGLGIILGERGGGRVGVKEKLPK